MPARLNLTGKTFGNCEFISESAPYFAPCGVKYRQGNWRCLRCGTVFVALNSHVVNGHTRSCKCLQVETCKSANITHGFTNSRAYSIWCNKIQKCFNPNTPQFKDWGGRGITMCKGWQAASNFLADMGPGKIGWSVERVDNDGNYSCGRCSECIEHGWQMNCVWATAKRQGRNKRNNHIITTHGITGCIAEVCERLGVKENCIRMRLWRGWTIERTFSSLDSIRA